MRELDFDIFINNDAGRSFYRGLLIYAALHIFKHHNISPVQTRLITNVIERQFWKPSNCYVQIKPRLRWFYSAMLISFVPFASRSLMETYFDQYFYLKHMPSAALGFINGIAIACLTLS